jgi:hypothetical protein
MDNNIHPAVSTRKTTFGYDFDQFAGALAPDFDW